jgi:hypothetical protein
MKIQRFNEKFSDETRDFLIKKHNKSETTYQVILFNPSSPNVTRSLSFENLDTAINFYLQEDNKDGYYIVKHIKESKVMPDEELEELIALKKYNI